MQRTTRMAWLEYPRFHRPLSEVENGIQSNKDELIKDFPSYNRKLLICSRLADLLARLTLCHSD